MKNYLDLQLIELVTKDLSMNMKINGEQMGNVIIVCIIIVCVIIGIRETVKHMKGQSACCGGTQGMSREKHKLEGKKLGDYTLKISDMKCENCEIRIENAICRSQPGLSARASHKKGRVIISFDREIDREKVKQAIQNAGYHVVE